MSVLIFQDEANDFPAAVWSHSELLSGSGTHVPHSVGSSDQMKEELFICSAHQMFIRCFLHCFQSETGAEEAEEEHVELFTTPQTKMGAATSDFGYNLFRALASREATANIFLAPISVSAALTQLSLGDRTNQF